MKRVMSAPSLSEIQDLSIGLSSTFRAQAHSVMAPEVVWHAKDFEGGFCLAREGKIGMKQGMALT